MQRVKAFLQQESPVKWLFLGDSITHGAVHTLGWRDYTQHFAERVRFELERPRDIIINTGISGHTTRDILLDFEWRVAQFRPDVVFLMIGMNDAADRIDLSVQDFKRNLYEICTRTANLSSIGVLQTTCAIRWEDAPERTQLPEYMEAVRQVSGEIGWPLVDHFAYYQQAMEAAPERAHSWMNNAIHPNHFGHMAFAELLLDSLGIFDAESRLGQILKSRP